MAVALIWAGCSAVGAGATVATNAGSLRAVVGVDPFTLTLRSGGHTVLEQYPGTGSGPSGPLGFRSAGTWHHATRVIEAHRDATGYVATLATDEPMRTIVVRILSGREGVIRLTAGLAGPAAGIDAMGIGFRNHPGERHLGFGERSNAVDQSGQVVEDYTEEGAFQPEERPIIPNAFVPAWGFRARDDATYFPMPWLLSSAGFGVLLDNTQTSYFRLGTDTPGAWSVEAVGGPEGTADALNAPPVTHLDLRFFAGPTPADALRRLTRSIGRQPPPRPWFLAPWYQPSGDDRENVIQLRHADAPLSVVQTYTHYLPCGSQQGHEADQRKRAALLHSLGVAVTTYFNPMICTSYQPVYGEAQGAGALTEDATGSPYVYRYNQFTVSQFDFTAAAGRSLYRQLLGEAAGHGYDGWMEDFGEYTPLDSRSADGSLGYAMHNRYPRLYHCTAGRWARKQRPLLRFIRSGWTGAARCAPVVWGGDPTTDWGYDGLRSVIQNGLSMGLSGVGIWGSDIGGFFSLGARQLTPELLSRWVQAGAVSGVMRTEADGIAVPAKSRAQVTDPDQIVNWRRYTKLRTQLYPYIRAAAATYRRTGMPIMRHLALRYPRDPQATEREDEFLFGPDLLAAPVIEPGARTRTLYLPRGRWVDLWRSLDYVNRDGSLRLRRLRVLGGSREATLPAPLQELPLLARQGALLAMLPADVDTLAPYGHGRGLVHLGNRLDRISLLALPHGRSVGSFLEHGRLRSVEGRGAWTLQIRDTRERRWSVQASLVNLRDPIRPCSVLFDGRALPGAAWDYDPAPGVLRMRFEARRSNLVVNGCGQLSRR